MPKKPLLVPREHGCQLGWAMVSLSADPDRAETVLAIGGELRRSSQDPAVACQGDPAQTRDVRNPFEILTAPGYLG